MKYYKCDVCGKVLPLGRRYKSGAYDYDLCGRCKVNEKRIKIRDMWLEKMKEMARDD